MLPVGLCAQLACIWEATARKPGNVHRYRDFADTTYLDFLVSAAAIAPAMENAAVNGVGATVLAAIRATRQVVQTNTNLGIVLLLAPLAAVPRDQPLRHGVAHILAGLTVNDSRAVFEAIRVASPAGLGRVADQDVHAEPTMPLREVMALAADRDLIARQYVNGFAEVFDVGLPTLTAAFDQGSSLEDGIIVCYLTLLARDLDSLIIRKCGLAEAEEVSRRAAALIPDGWRDAERLAGFDTWLREEGNSRNPGTTADLVAASLFAGLQDGRIVCVQISQVKCNPFPA